MPKKKGDEPENSGSLRSTRNFTLGQFYQDFRQFFGDDFAEEFFDEDTSRRAVFLHTYELTCGNVSAACAAAGIARQTYYNWLDSESEVNVDFKKKLAEIRPGERLGDLAELVVVKSLEAGSLDAAKMVLERNKFQVNRGYYQREKELPPDDLNEKEYKNLRRFIQKMAGEAERDYFTELEDFLKEFKDTVAKPLYDRLKKELDDNAKTK